MEITWVSTSLSLRVVANKIIPIAEQFRGSFYTWVRWINKGGMFASLLYDQGK